MTDKSEWVLITGGTGMTGSQITRTLLNAGYERIRITKRRDSRMDLISDLTGRVEIVETDINDVLGLCEAMQDVRTVIHTAGLVSFVPADKYRLLKANMEGTASLVNVCLEKEVRNLLHISSVAALGRSSDRQGMDETSTWVPGKMNSNYAYSKYLAEMEVWRAREEGMRTAVINPSIILGAGFWDSGSANLLKGVASGLPFYPKGGTGFVDLRDVADMVLRILELDAFEGERYICNGHNVSYRELFQSLSECLGVKAPKRPLSRFLGSVGWRWFYLVGLFTGKRPTITRESIRTSMYSFSYNNRKSRENLSFEYRSLQNTVRDICNAYKESEKKGLDYGTLKTG